MFSEKSILFKLLSEENVHVVFAKARTASFDVKNRVLTIPAFNFVSESTILDDELKSKILDLFGGHEVGHALYTPVSSSEEIKNWNVPFAIVNIVEDCRIERFIKNRYPGLKPSFYTAYRYLFDANFFGTKHININKLSFVDRLNLFAKIGIYSEVKFTKKEMEYVKEAMTTTTFNEVVDLAQRIYKFSKEQKEQNTVTNKNSNNFENDEDFEENFDNSGNDENTEDDNFEDVDSDDNSKSSDDDSDDSDDSDNNGSSAEEGITQKNFDHKLLDEATKATEINQFKFVVNDLASYFVSYKEVINNPTINDQFNNLCKNDTISAKFEDWITNNNKVVNYLVKEFEMKRAASAYRNSLISNSGVLNTKKLFAYQLTEDLFKKVTSVKDGKNHSLTVLVDWSGSMQKYDMNVTRQTITIANFCRRAQIPFNIYLFTSFKDNKYENEDLNESEIYVNNVRLINIFNNNMSNSEFVKMSKILFAGVSTSYLIKSYTPLNSALMLVKYQIREMILKNNTDKNTLIVISDGQDTEGFYIKNWDKIYDSKNYIVNPINNMSYEYRFCNTAQNTFNIMKLLKNELDINIMWLFLAENLRSAEVNLFTKLFFTKIQQKEFSSNGFINFNADNVDTCQIINNKYLSSSTSKNEINNKVRSKTALKNEFSKMMNSNIINKNLLNQWIKTFNL